MRKKEKIYEVILAVSKNHIILKNKVKPYKAYMHWLWVDNHSVTISPT